VYEAWWAGRRTDHHGQEKPSQLQLFACRVGLWDFLAPGQKGNSTDQEILQWDRPYDATRVKVVDYAEALVQQNAVVMYPYEHAPGAA
jgi:hypothetical protein